MAQSLGSYTNTLVEYFSLIFIALLILGSCPFYIPTKRLVSSDNISVLHSFSTILSHTKTLPTKFL